MRVKGKTFAKWRQPGASEDHTLGSDLAYQAPSSYEGGVECPALPDLLMFAADPESCDADMAGQLGEHLGRCKSCAHQLEIAARRQSRALFGRLAEIVPTHAKRRMPVMKVWGAAATAAAILLALGLYQQREVSAQHVRTIADQSSIISKYEYDIRDLRAELQDLRLRIDVSGLSTAILLDDPKAFSVSGPDRVKVSGGIRPKFVQEVSVRWGPKPNDAVVSLYKGGPEPDLRSETVRFDGLSPMFSLNGEPIAPTLEIVPYPEMQRLFPEHFTADKLQYSRNFLLAKGGIQADPELVAISSPRDGEAVEQHSEIDGQISIIEGYPVVFVKPSGNSWWVQDPATVTDGAFSARLNVGNETTPAGTKFHIVVTVARSKSEALKFQPGMELPALPPGLIRSNPITVTRQ